MPFLLIRAAAPINLYGASKLCSDKLFISANNFKGNRDLRFIVVRYGNVVGSRGSVIPLFLKQKKSGTILITHKEMTRFSIFLKEGVQMVLNAIKDGWGGELFIPKIPSYKIMDVVEAIAPECQKKIIGVRPGEKLHEEMITENDSFNTLDCGYYYVILPSVPLWSVNEYKKQFNANYVEQGFRYNSGTNDRWLTIPEIREMVQTYIDSNNLIGDNQT